MLIQSDESGNVTASGRISATLLITLFLQVAGALIWATHLEARVNSVEQQSVNAVMLNEKFARLDERLEHLRQTIEEMHQQVEQINKRLTHVR